MMTSQDNVKNLFFTFIEQNNIPHLKNLMAMANEKKIDIHFKKSGLTPLQFAAKNTDISSATIKELLAKFDLNEKNHKGQTTLQIAIEADNLIFAKTCFEEKLSTISASDANHLLIYFSKKNQVDCVEQFLKKHSVDINFKNKNGFTALSIAAHEGCSPVISKLIKARATIHSLRKIKTTAVAILLLQAKANISELKTSLNKLLSLNLKDNDIENIQSLLDAAKPYELADKKESQCLQNIKDHALKLALKSTSHGDNEWEKWTHKRSSVRVLLEAKANMSKSGWNPFEYLLRRHYLGRLLVMAASENNKNAVQILLDQKADINYQKVDITKKYYHPNIYSCTKMKGTALYFATFNGADENIHLLLNARANVHLKSQFTEKLDTGYYWENRDNYREYKPINVAQNISTVCLLLNANAYIGDNWEKYNKKEYSRMLTRACEDNQLDYIRALLKAGAPLNDHALLAAIQNSNINAIRLLLRFKANPNSAISFSIDSEKLDIVKILLDAKADPNQNILDAAKNGNIDAIKFLLDAKANISTRKNGRTAIDVAKNEQVRELLYTRNLPLWYIKELGKQRSKPELSDKQDKIEHVVKESKQALEEDIPVTRQSIFQNSKPHPSTPLLGEAPGQKIITGYFCQ